MANEKFSIKEALNYGWTTFKNHGGFFIGLMVILGGATVLVSVIANKIFGNEGAGHIAGSLIVQLFSLVLGIFTTRIALNIYDNDDVSIPKMGPTFSYLIYYLGGKILYGAIVFAGSLLLVVPGIIWAFMFMYVGLLIVDKGLDPIAALKESKAITYGYKWDLFFFALVLLVFNLVGFLCFVIGIFVTAPISMMAGVYVYRRLNSPVVA